MNRPRAREREDLRYLEGTWRLLDRGRHIRNWEFGTWHKLPVNIEEPGEEWRPIDYLIGTMIVVLAVALYIYWRTTYGTPVRDMVPVEVGILILCILGPLLLVNRLRKGSESSGPKEGGQVRLMKLSMKLLSRAVKAGLDDRWVKHSMGDVHEVGDMLMRIVRFDDEEVRLALFVHPPSSTSVVFISPGTSMHRPLVRHIKDAIDEIVPPL